MFTAPAPLSVPARAQYLAFRSARSAGVGRLFCPLAAPFGASAGGRFLRREAAQRTFVSLCAGGALLPWGLRSLLWGCVSAPCPCVPFFCLCSGRFLVLGGFFGWGFFLVRVFSHFSLSFFIFLDLPMFFYRKGRGEGKAPARL